MQFVGRHLQTTGISQYNLRIVKALVSLIDDNLIKHTRLGILALYVKIEIWYFVIKDALGYFHRRLSLLHAEEECAQINLSPWSRKVLKIERNTGQGQHDDQYRTHDTYERHAGSFHGE